MTKEIKTDAWNRPIWVPADYPFVVRSYRQSSQTGSFGWACNNVGQPLETYAEARAIADKPMGIGETRRVVVQAMNPEQWSGKGSWHTCFERKRGGKITEAGPK